VSEGKWRAKSLVITSKPIQSAQNNGPNWNPHFLSEFSIFSNEIPSPSNSRFSRKPDNKTLVAMLDFVLLIVTVVLPKREIHANKKSLLMSELVSGIINSQQGNLPNGYC
jgi:hypothetical protein